MTGYEEQQNSGKKLSETNQAEIQRTFGDFVDLPSHGDRLHLDGNLDEESCQLINGEIRILERNTTREPGIRRRRHRSLLCHKIRLWSGREFNGSATPVFRDRPEIITSRT